VGTLFLIAILVNFGMWAERFVIIAVSLSRDFIPSSWANYTPTWVDWGTLFGSICTFGFLFMLFLRFIPAIPMSEVKELRRELEHEDRHARQAAAGGGHASWESSATTAPSSTRPAPCGPRGIRRSTCTVPIPSTGPRRRSACAARPCPW
jgi:hypothetical protein